MTLASLHVLVAGGGIAGLALAGALRRAGARVRLVEKAPALRPVGAGLILQPNAVAALDRLGVDVRPVGHRVTAARILHATGRELSSGDFAALEPTYGPSFAVARPELHEVLVAGLGDVEVRLGATATALHEGDDGVRVATSDGATDRYDLLVGADGLRSGVRALLGDDPGVVYSGYTCWRALVDGVALDTPVEMWGPGKRAGVVPLAGGRAYVFLVANAPARDPGPDVEGVRALFAGFGGAVPDVLARLSADRLLHHDIEEVGDVRWGRPRAWLLGDAAHALTPNMGQGAGLALEDAAEALGLLEAAPDLAAAHARLVAARDARVRAIKARSRRIGKVAQWESGPARAVRDWLVRMTPATATTRAVEELARWRPGAA